MDCTDRFHKYGSETANATPKHDQSISHVTRDSGECIAVLAAWAQAGRCDGRERGDRTVHVNLFSNPSFHPVDLSTEQVLLADELRFTRDPFKALIVAAARSIDLPLLTRDTDIRASGTVRVIW